MIKKILTVLTTYEIELVEFMSGFAALMWGLWLLNPALQTFSMSASFSSMAMLASENVWGFGMIMIGAAQIEAIISYDLDRRKHSSLILSTLWIFITAMLAHANVASTGVAIYGTFAAFTTWSYLRLSQRVEIISKFSEK